MAKHKAGGKITTSHTSIIDAALASEEELVLMDELDDVILGYSPDDLIGD